MELQNMTYPFIYQSTDGRWVPAKADLSYATDLTDEKSRIDLKCLKPEDLAQIAILPNEYLAWLVAFVVDGLDQVASREKEIDDSGCEYKPYCILLDGTPHVRHGEVYVPLETAYENGSEFVRNYIVQNLAFQASLAKIGELRPSMEAKVGEEKKE